MKAQQTGRELRESLYTTFFLLGALVIFQYITKKLYRKTILLVAALQCFFTEQQIKN